VCLDLVAPLLVFGAHTSMYCWVDNFSIEMGTELLDFLLYISQSSSAMEEWAEKLNTEFAEVDQFELAVE